MWPDESAEAAYLAERRGGTGAEEPVVPAQAVTAKSDPLPPLEELLARVPAGVRELLDELFRAKFTQVVRVAKL